MRMATLLLIAAATLLLLGGCSREAGMKKTYATIETEKGNIKLELFTKDAPITATNFIGLANSGFYDGLTFHRVIRGFVIQGGDPKGDGTGGFEKNIPLEISPKLTHNDGAVAMARAQDPNSASSQFYICEGAQHGLDGNYAVFGQVVEGFDVVKRIEQGDRMLKVTIS